MVKVGQWFRAVSPAVIHGMLAGIGVLIFASQFHLMVDDDPRGSGIQNIISIPESVIKGLFPQDGTAHHQAALIGVVTIGLLAFWATLAPKRLRAIPAPLVAITIATFGAWWLSFDIKRVDVPDRLTDAVSWPTWDSIDKLFHHQGMVAGRHRCACRQRRIAPMRGRRRSNAPRPAHQVRQGTRRARRGNTLCGLLGALPMTGVIVRSSVNVNSGAKSRLSAILHGAWILMFVIFGKPLLVLIPKAALAALLVYTGYKLVNVKEIKKLARISRREVAIYFVTLVGIVLTDLLTGVLLGVGVAAATLLARLSRFEGERMPSDDGLLNIHLKGCCTFLNLPKVAALLESIPPEADVHFHVDELDAIDHACLELLDQWEKQREGVGGRLTIDWGEIHSRFHGHIEPSESGVRREFESASR